VITVGVELTLAEFSRAETDGVSENENELQHINNIQKATNRISTITSILGDTS